MLRVMDRRTGRPSDLPARGRRGTLTLRIHPTCAQDPADATDLRLLLVGDVLLRTVERWGVQVLHALAGPPPDRAASLRQAMADLGIHPPLDEGTGPGAGADAHVCAEPPDAATAGVWLRVGRVRRDIPAPRDTEAGAAGGTDPLAVRLALLAVPYGDPVGLTTDVLADAARTLAVWRARVAHWADSPSKPVPADLARRADAALADDLGTPGVLRLLSEVEAADGLPDGAKFETFALLDRVLGLELTREVGRRSP
ncbi:hypothetical protein ACFOOM_15500 [Streptomyces echinoruber]|nr:hypothetical protein [Streptomyces echinoruber]